MQAEQIAEAYLSETHIGQPSRLREPDTLQLLLAALHDGASRENAAREAGIAPRTLFNWIEKAKAGDEHALAFLQAIEKAEASVERRCARNVLKASEHPQFWAAGMTYLERRWPERWGKREGDTSGPRIVVQIGVNASQVQGLTVNVQAVSPTPFAPDCLESAQRNSLETHAFANPSSLINSDYGNQPAALDASQIPAHECQGAPCPVGGASQAGRVDGGVKGLAGAEEEKRP